jgi:CheY-like chemotaxis protein
MQRIYRRTEAGNKAWDQQDPKVPAEYRRVLGIADPEAHFEVIRGYLQRLPERLLSDLLSEIEELGLLMSEPAGAERDLDFTDNLKRPRLLAEDQRRLAKDTTIAGVLISEKGVYLSEARIRNLPHSAKPPASTTILIVEDDPDQLSLADMRVAMAGYRARPAASAQALLESLKREGAPDLLLLDVMLPDGDGFDILGKLRGHPNYALVPIVMLTVKADPGDILRGLSLGADGYITKPYSKAVLADTLRRVLGA